jgi:hypothetical protein
MACITMNRRGVVLVMCLVVMFALSGCGKSGPKLWPVTGRVTFLGKPVSAASIRFSNPQAAIDLIAKLDTDGKYTVATASGSGLPEGTYQTAIMPAGKRLPLGTFEARPAPDRPDIPQAYRSPTTSGLIATVKSGCVVFDVDMQPAK